MVRDTGFEPVTPTVSSSGSRARLGLSFHKLGHDGSIHVNFKASEARFCHLSYTRQPVSLWSGFRPPYPPRRGCGVGVNSWRDHLIVSGCTYEAFFMLAFAVTHFVSKDD